MTPDHEGAVPRGPGGHQRTVPEGRDEHGCECDACGWDDVTDPAYWARAKFAIKAPVAPPLHSKLSCLECSEGTAYGDGTGGYTCFRCGWSC